MSNIKEQSSQNTEFTKGMLQTLVEYFDFFADGEGILIIEVNKLGIWVEEPNTRTKKFIGKARHSAKELESMRRADMARRKN